MTKYSGPSVPNYQEGEITTPPLASLVEVGVMISMRTKELTRKFLEAKSNLSPRTVEQYQSATDFLEREIPKMPKKPEPLRKALNHANTIWVRSAYWRVWSAFFAWCNRQYGTRNPMQLVERPRIPDIEMRSLEPDELAMVLAAAEDLQDKAVVALGLDSGVRASEFGHLRILDVGADTLRLWGKGNRQARVPISPETRQLLQVLIDQDGSDLERPLFVGNDGKPMSRFTVYRIVRRCMEQAGIHGPKLGPHTLRHSLGKNFIANGGDAFTLQRIMRHRDIATTQKYVNLAMRDVIEKHRQHSPLRDAIRGSQGVLTGR